jgi:hypothetical protein
MALLSQLACHISKFYSDFDFTYSFIVPLVGKTRKWLSLLDQKRCYGYFLTARIMFWESVPDVQLSWMAQAQSILSKYGPSMACKPSDLRVRKPIAYRQCA